MGKPCYRAWKKIKPKKSHCQCQSSLAVIVNHTNPSDAMSAADAIYYLWWAVGNLVFCWIYFGATISSPLGCFRSSESPAAEWVFSQMVHKLQIHFPLSAALMLILIKSCNETMHTLNAILYVMSSFNEIRQTGELSAVKFLICSSRKSGHSETDCDFREIRRAVFGVRVMD